MEPHRSERLDSGRVPENRVSGFLSVPIVLFDHRQSGQFESDRDWLYVKRADGGDRLWACARLNCGCVDTESAVVGSGRCRVGVCRVGRYLADS